MALEQSIFVKQPPSGINTVNPLKTKIQFEASEKIKNGFGTKHFCEATPNKGSTKLIP